MTTDFMQRGYIAVQSGDHLEAVGWFERAVSENPKDAQARACLGQSLCWSGRRGEGIAHLRQSGELLVKKSRRTRDISLVLGLTEQMQFWGDYAGALELGKLATQINGSDFRGFQLLAQTHSRLNQSKSALAAGRKAVKLAPNSAMLQILLATLEIAEAQHDAAKKRLQKVLESPLSPEEGFRAHKELARALDKLGEFDQVFGHLHASAELSELLPEVRKQSLGLVPTMIASHKAGFDRELLARWQTLEFPPDEPPPVFLIGFMRSGTTLTQEVLDTHPEVFVADETDMVMAMHAELHRIDTRQGSTADKLRRMEVGGIRRLRSIYWEKVRGRYGDALGTRRLVDKTTMNTIDLGLINCVFPDAKVVFVMRDPRDICLSCFMQTMTPSPSTVHLFDWQRTAEFYALIMEWWSTIKFELTLEYLEFRYEDAVASFEPTFRKILDFLNLPWDAAVSQFHRHAAGKYINSPSFSQVAQPLYSSSLQRWRHYEADFAPVMDTLRPFVDAFGYDR